MTDALGGAAAGVTTELIFYGLDSLKVISRSLKHLLLYQTMCPKLCTLIHIPFSKVMQQAGNTKKYSFRAMFRGAVPIALLGSAPSVGIYEQKN